MVGECDNCGFIAPLRESDSGMQCQPCYVAGLEHGHAHGIHTDHAWDAEDREVLGDCPSCTDACRVYDTTGAYNGLEMD